MEDTGELYKAIESLQKQQKRALTSNGPHPHTHKQQISLLQEGTKKDDHDYNYQGYYDEYYY